MSLAETLTPDSSPATLLLRPSMALPLMRYRFIFRMEDELRLPEYAGSLLRGAFGAALRRTACMTGAATCAGCPLTGTCPYPAIFETPAPSEHALQRFSNVPNPYVIEPPELGLRRVGAGETLSFHMVLIGRALARLPLIVHALRRAFAHGVGPTRAKGSLIDVEAGETPLSVWDATQANIEPHPQALSLPELPRTGAITLRISTPLRLQHQGRPVRPEGLQPRTLFTALLRRASLLLELHAGLPPVGTDAARLAVSAGRLEDQRRLEWKDWTRFSSRQKQEMTLGGVVGEWTILGELDELLPWFWLGQYLHVGKNATMGMGGYSLVW
jgi:hypothetical protein